MTASGQARPGSGIARDAWRRAGWVALWPIGLGAFVALLALSFSDDRSAGHEVSAVMVAVLGVSLLASGLLALRQRPGGRLGPLMVLLGLWWMAGQLLMLALWPPAFTLGVFIADSWVLLLVIFLLSFPEGRVFSRADRLLVAAFALAAIPLELLWFLFWDPGPPGNALMISNDPDSRTRASGSTSRSPRLSCSPRSRRWRASWRRSRRPAGRRSSTC